MNIDTEEELRKFEMGFAYKPKKVVTMKIRELELKIQIDQDNPPSWLWESHKDKKSINGICVKEIEDIYDQDSDWKWE